MPDGDFGFKLVGHVVGHVAAGHVARDGRTGCQHRSGPLQQAHHGGVVIEHLVAERRRPPRGGDSGGGEQVLDPVRDAVQRPTPVAGGQFPLRPARLCQREVGCQGNDGVVTRSQGAQAVEKGLGQRHRRYLPRPHQLGKLPQRPEDYPWRCRGVTRHCDRG